MFRFSNLINLVIQQVAVRRKDAFSDEQIRALATQDIVMLEKTTGQKTYGSIEKGSLEAAKRIKKINPKVKILFYLNSMVHYGGYDANKDWKEEWAMWDGANKKHLKWNNKYLSYNHNNAEFREWWLKRGLDMVAHDEIDGIFIDGIVKAGVRWLPVKNHKWDYMHTAKELRKRLPEGKILIGNALRAGSGTNGNLNHLQYLDGSYLENWTQNLETTMGLISSAMDRKRIIMLNAQPHHFDQNGFNQLNELHLRYEFAGQPQFINFYLGIFLLVAGQGAHISYHTGVDLNPKKKHVFDNTRFEEITRKLGQPLGPARKKGKEYWRDFEYLEVHVNLRTMKAHLTVKDQPIEKVPNNETCPDGEAGPDEHAGLDKEECSDEQACPDEEVGLDVEGGSVEERDTGSGNDLSSDEEEGSGGEKETGSGEEL